MTVTIGRRKLLAALGGVAACGACAAAGDAGGRDASQFNARDFHGPLAARRSGVRGQGGDHDGPDRFHRARRPGQARSCRQPRATGRQLDGELGVRARAVALARDASLGRKQSG